MLKPFLEPISKKRFWVLLCFYFWAFWAMQQPLTLRFPWAWAKTSNHSRTWVSPLEALNASPLRCCRWPYAFRSSSTDKPARWQETLRPGWRKWSSSSMAQLGFTLSTRLTVRRNAPFWISSSALRRLWFASKKIETVGMFRGGVLVAF